MNERERRVTVLQLYPHEMNIYGDRGNVLTLLRRLEWHGYQAEVVYHHPGRKFPTGVDLVVGGGGQDSGQEKVQNDLLAIAENLHALSEVNVPMLMVCGLYQLFGRFFKTAEGRVIRGIEIFDAETHASSSRMIGNIVLDSPYGGIVGYENHSGKTFLGATATPLGTVTKGAGNNGEDKTEGAVHHNVFGTYLHGSVLPKNPQLADTLIERAVTRRFGDFQPGDIDDSLAAHARAVARQRPR